MSKPINRIAGLCLQSNMMVYWKNHRRQFFHLVLIILVQLFLLAFFYQKADAQCSLFCNAVTNVALDQDCEAEIWYDMILQDPYNPLVCAPSSPPSFQVIVMNQAGTVLNTSPFITEANIGQSLMVKVRHLPTMNSCWGQINIQDNLAPVLHCPRDTAIACSENADPSLTGQPVADDCSFFQVTYDDQLQNFPCQPNLKRIIRTWRATDAFGQQSTCQQNIFIKRPELDAVSFPPNQDGIQSPAISCDSFALHPEWTEPQFTGFPTIANQPFHNGGACTIGYAYQDQIVPLCEQSFKILRKWTIVDWCSSQVKEAFQIIKVEDVVPPVFNLPDTLRVSTTSDVNCTANVRLPMVQITDNCGSQFQVKIFTDHGTLDQNGGMLFDVPEGTHAITYRGMDNCGNISRDTMQLVIYDGTPPTGICRTSTQIALGSNGTAIIPAYLFDEGSYDNCCLDKFLIKPQGSNLPFAPQQTIDCSSLDSTSYFTIKIDDCAGNSNYCSVKVSLKESLSPIIQCPANITLTCFEDPFDVARTGQASSWDNCGIDTLLFEDNNLLDDCHTGTVLRTWKTRDLSGNQSTCQQS
ncbi:MAG: hypothetical protein KDC24_07990, partial [Saprospiraceae bacterium]|nr:hypothetical protein [Saprospiraceae bacterium]